MEIASWCVSWSVHSTPIYYLMFFLKRLASSSMKNWWFPWSFVLCSNLKSTTNFCQTNNFWTYNSSQAETLAVDWNHFHFVIAVSFLVCKKYSCKESSWNQSIAYHFQNMNKCNTLTYDSIILFCKVIWWFIFQWRQTSFISTCDPVVIISYFPVELSLFMFDHTLFVPVVPPSNSKIISILQLG